MQRYSFGNFVELAPVKISPTCEDLGIPTEAEDIAYSFCRRSLIRNAGLHLERLEYDTMKASPFSPLCMIPVPTPLTLEAGLEPSFIRKRNERERERVRCVNDGYERLKEHLPIENKDRRISKVETLRAAIQYIKHLQSLLSETDEDGSESKSTLNEEDTCEPPRRKRVKKERRS